MSRRTTDAYDAVVKAAAAGDTTAQAALDALDQAAAATASGAEPRTGRERGLAEARRRFGPLPGGDTARGGIS